VIKTNEWAALLIAPTVTLNLKELWDKAVYLFWKMCQVWAAKS